jgi:hypothetical protein
MNKKVKNILERAVKTFIEAALAYFIPALAGVDFFGGNTTKTVLIGMAISAAASGLSAVWNGVISPLIENHKAGTVFEETPSDDFITEKESEGE